MPYICHSSGWHSLNGVHPQLSQNTAPSASRITAQPLNTYPFFVYAFAFNAKFSEYLTVSDGIYPLPPFESYCTVYSGNGGYVNVRVIRSNITVTSDLSITQSSLLSYNFSILFSQPLYVKSSVCSDDVFELIPDKSCEPSAVKLNAAMPSQIINEPSSSLYQSP